MHNPRSILSATIGTLVLSVVTSSSQAITIPGGGYDVPMPESRFQMQATSPATPGHLGVYFDVQDTNWRSELDLDANDNHVVCHDLTAADCQPADKWITKTDGAGVASSLAGNCATNPESYCVAGFTVTTASGEKLVAKPSLRTRLGLPGLVGNYQAAKSDGIPSGDQPWIWETTDGAGKTVRYLALGNFTRVVHTTDGKSWWWEQPNLRFALYPVTAMPPVQVPDNTGCLIKDEVACYMRAPFDEGVKITLTLQLPAKVVAWVNGRVKDPVVFTQPGASANYEQLVVEGYPDEEIIAGSWVDLANVSDAFLNSCCNENGGRRYGWFSGLNRNGNALAAIEPGHDSAIPLYKQWEQFMGNTALSNYRTFRINSSPIAVPPGKESCIPLTAGLQGVVTTNASVYTGGRPDFDVQNSQLVYGVAGPHYASDGKTLNVGTYGLAMTAAAMKCLYGVRTVPNYVSISITDENGAANVSTVTLHTVKDWVYLSADAFHFSAPQIKVGMVKEPASAKPATPVKPTITCVKGKTVKKVVGAKCPAGYKKK